MRKQRPYCLAWITRPGFRCHWTDVLLQTEELAGKSTSWSLFPGRTEQITRVRISKSKRENKTKQKKVFKAFEEIGPSAKL